MNVFNYFFFTHKTFTGLTVFVFESAKMFPSVLSSGLNKILLQIKFLVTPMFCNVH